MIRFFTEDIPFTLSRKIPTRQWLTALALKEGFSVGELNYIFCSDEYLLQVNREYLEHDYYTDIITFDNSEEENRLEGDIFVSIDRVRDNARQLNIPEEQELRRVLAHGLLHLCGYGDKTDEEVKRMREKEEESLIDWNNRSLNPASGQSDF
ncbi:rRNA maturation RNase YbeY [Larkinella humicola]|uniref:Endoribonuclease YbeY n=1 Tax=Larkinella humicola TaxID=2607654 RepID=A0A5N1JCY5_9BACT|nr:rRNA maturation RNase YbeY [Larkinella humicola]KAA9352797.1 rRNA maturation RNase YbeY [Larkinella humicola]